jgi:hypothetical protein
LSQRDNLLDGLTIDEVERLRAADGVAMDELIEAPLNANPGEPGAA